MEELKMWELANGFLRENASTALSPEEKKIMSSEAEKMIKFDKTVAVDYHGTIMINDKVNETMKAKLQEMRNEGYHIIVYTSGITDSPGSLIGIQAWLQQNEVPYDEIWQRQGKPDADIYIEDKAVRPSEIQDKTIDEIEALPEKENQVIGG